MSIQLIRSGAMQPFDTCKNQSLMLLKGSSEKRVISESESDVTWPSMVTHTQNLFSAINPSKVHTHSSEHTHTVNTHPEQWAAIYAAAHGEQLGVRCLAQGHLSRGIEGGYSLPDLRLELRV